MATLVLTDAQRHLLKSPLGELVKGSPAECNRKLKEVITREKPTCIVLVGDSVSRHALKVGVKADVIIIDRLEKRETAIAFDYKAKHRFQTKNPPGTITSQTWTIVEEALREGDSVVNVEGEEDLLTLVAVLSSPERSLVVYGQPDEGIVLVRVSADKKAEINRIVTQMDRRA